MSSDTRPELRGKFLEDAVRFTSAQTTFGEDLVEKDYYCSVLLQRLASCESGPLVFKGGTCLSKVYASFYRLSEDLDFMIPTDNKTSRADRRRRIRPVKDLIESSHREISTIAVPDGLRGHNESKQYIALATYASCLREGAGSVKVEVALREELLLPAETRPAATLLMHPFNGRPAVTEFMVRVMARKEMYAEKLRAALSRKEPAIRDFFDIDHALRTEAIDLADASLLRLCARKLDVSGGDEVDVSPERKRQLEEQMGTELVPMLRPMDLDAFDLDRVFALVVSFAGRVSKLR